MFEIRPPGASETLAQTEDECLEIGDSVTGVPSSCFNPRSAVNHAK